MIHVRDESGWQPPSGEHGWTSADVIAQATWLFGELNLHPATTLTVLLVDEDRMSALHEQWMDEPGPTDVLSFPMDAMTAGTPDRPSGPGELGDIVICPEFAARQAIAAGHTSRRELQLLLTHGVLHLLGHDHAQPQEHAVMFALQDRLLAGWSAKEGR